MRRIKKEFFMRQIGTLQHHLDWEETRPELTAQEMRIQRLLNYLTNGDFATENKMIKLEQLTKKYSLWNRGI